MSEVTTNRLEIIQNRINQYDIRFPVATLAKELNLNKGYVSGVLNGQKPISDNFWETFNKVYPDKSNVNGYMPSASANVLTGAHVTLQDYIDEIKTSRDRWFNLVSSILGQIAEDTNTALAYQKAWVEYEAEKESAGDDIAKAELMHKMNILVRGYVTGRSSIHTEDEIGKQRKG